MRSMALDDSGAAGRIEHNRMVAIKTLAGPGIARCVSRSVDNYGARAVMKDSFPTRSVFREISNNHFIVNFVLCSIMLISIDTL